MLHQLLLLVDKQPAKGVHYTHIYFKKSGVVENISVSTSRGKLHARKRALE